MRGKSRMYEAIEKAEGEGALPKVERTTLEDECTHILSERLNDQAPLFEERYRPHARRLIEVITNDQRSRIRRELLEEISAWRRRVFLANEGDPNATEREMGANAALQSVLAALDRICPEETAPSTPPSL